MSADPFLLDATTFNIRHGAAEDGLDAWAFRKERAIEALRRCGGDVVGLQEALEFQIRDLLEAFPEYGAVGVGREDGKRRGEHSLILFRRARFRLAASGTFWLSDTPGVQGSASWGNENVRICTWAHLRERGSGRGFFHFNTHLDHESAFSRSRSIELILSRIAGRGSDDPVVLTGDFNVGEEDPVIATVKAADFRDSFRDVQPDATEVGTFNGFFEGFGSEKIDYVFVGAGWSAEGAEIRRERIGGRWPSDHAPVTAQVRLNLGAPEA